jgi:bifunctional UDP-N-acetylglucosamine pyrophosphorylase/glucosamine-1-phosphate N-acetyltransferase
MSGTIIETFLEDDRWLARLDEPWKLLTACKNLLLSKKSSLRIHPSVKMERNVTIVGPVSIQQGSRVCNGSYIVGPVLIGKRSTIGPNCFVRPYSILGDETRVGPGVELKNVLVGKQTAFFHYCSVLDSIIGRNCDISSGTVTLVSRHDARNVRIEWDGKLQDTGLRKFGCVIGNDTVLSGNVVVLPGKVIGENCRVGFNVTVDRNIANNTFVRPKQELEMKKWESPRTRWRTPHFRMEGVPRRNYRLAG